MPTKKKPTMPPAVKQFFVDAGKRGAKKRFSGLTKKEKSELARKAAQARWNK
jgi:hypothetical protein